METPRITVLAVDDNEAQNYALRRTLEHAGFNVVPAFNGTETLQLAKTMRPSAIVLDVHLPDVNGFEVCSRLKKDPATADIAVVFLSATCQDSTALNTGEAVGGAAFLFAPVDPEQLLTVLRGALAGRGGALAPRPGTGQ